jgi:hypothetical protein
MRVGFLLLGLILPLALGAADEKAVRIRECKVACRRGGWQDGTYLKGFCVCIDYVEYEQALERGVAVNSQGRL